jgi:lipid-binding SYLF domain-containing protein
LQSWELHPQRNLAIGGIMQRILQTLTIIVTFCVFGAAVPTRAAEHPQALVDRATATVNTMRSDGSFGNAPELLERAKAIMIVPQLVKGGFVFGAEGGEGVLLRKEGHGWSNPAFYNIAAGSFGLQIGLEESELVLIVMSNRALDAWMRGKFKLGADAGLTVLVVGTNGEVATAGAGADVIAWARTKGAYAGITLSGAVISPRTETDEDYYQQKVSAKQIVFDHAGHNDGAHELRHALERAVERAP